MALPFELGAAGVVVWVDVEETARTTELEGLVRFHTLTCGLVAIN